MKGTIKKIISGLIALLLPKKWYFCGYYPGNLVLKQERKPSKITTNLRPDSVFCDERNRYFCGDLQVTLHYYAKNFL